MEICEPTTVEEAMEAVLQHRRVLPVGGATLPSLLEEAAPPSVRLSTRGLTGIVEYDPTEFTLTVRAGTPLATLDAALAEHDQYLPFDPPLANRGATIGGTIAAGLSGAGRLRYGGVRDFVLAVTLIDGLGTRVCGGGKVVKNAAGFDLPKLMVGSCGTLGVIADVTLKVFPRPAERRTVRLVCHDTPDALAVQTRLASSPLDLEALDFEPPATLWVRVAGLPEANEHLVARIAAVAERPAEGFAPGEEPPWWRSLDEGTWLCGQDAASADAGPPVGRADPTRGDRWVRVAVWPSRLADLEAELATQHVPRRYSVAGNLAWISWPAERPIGMLDELLRSVSLGGTVLRGSSPRVRLGRRPSAAMTARVKSALDPEGRFPSLAESPPHAPREEAAK